MSPCLFLGLPLSALLASSGWAATRAHAPSRAPLAAPVFAAAPASLASSALPPAIRALAAAKEAKQFTTAAERMRHGIESGLMSEVLITEDENLYWDGSRRKPPSDDVDDYMKQFKRRMGRPMDAGEFNAAFGQPIYQTHRGRLLRRIQSPEGPVYEMAAAEDGRLVRITEKSLQGHVLNYPPRDKSLVKPSEIAERAGVRYLIHGTYLRWIESILRDGQLNKSRYASHGVKEFYLEAIGPSQTGQTLNPSQTVGAYDAVLAFDLKTLDRDDYHISDGWHYGSKLPYSGTPQDLESLHASLWSAAHHSSNEIMFRNPIPLSGLSALWTRRGIREKLIEILQRIAYRPPGNVPLQRFVSEPEGLPERLPGI